MMFLLRSAFCIGLVVWMLPPRETAVAQIEPARLAQSAMQASLRGLCAEPVHCLSLAGEAALVATHRSTGAAASRDTLLAADLVPPWAGPDRNAHD